MYKHKPILGKALYPGLFLGLFILITAKMDAQTLYDESKVPEYILPPLIQSESAKEWQENKRAEWYHLLEREMFGLFPDSGISVSFEVKQLQEGALGGKAILKEVELQFRKGERRHSAMLLLILPVEIPATGVPVFLGLNFYGNHTIHADPSISISDSWMMNSESIPVENHQADARSRGARTHRWPVEVMLRRGFGLATMYYGDIDPDTDDDFENGIHSLIPEADKSELSSISAWAWGLSKALDYLETDSMIHATQVSVIGHSRLGKTALWAGATDARFAITISNNSGCGGAALSKRCYGETIAKINRRFPHWFNDRFNVYNDNEAALPFDQHCLIAMMAPRPVYIASANDDQWADPKGEFLAAKAAWPAYLLFKNAFGLDLYAEMPPLDKSIKNSTIGYHIRRGKHDLTLYDWVQYMDFADVHFER